MQIESFWGRVAQLAPSAPTVVIEDAVLEAVGQFLRDTQVWRETLVIALDDEVVLPIPQGATGVAIDAPHLPPHAFLPPDVLRFDTTPPDDEVAVRVILSVSDDAREIPDFVGAFYRRGITAAAAQRLLEIPGEPWSDANAALYHHRVYRDHVAKARVDVAKRYSRTTLSVKPVRFV